MEILTAGMAEKKKVESKAEIFRRIITSPDLYKILVVVGFSKNGSDSEFFTSLSCVHWDLVLDFHFEHSDLFDCLSNDQEYECCSLNKLQSFAQKEYQAPAIIDSKLYVFCNGSSRHDYETKKTKDYLRYVEIALRNIFSKRKKRSNGSRVFGIGVVFMIGELKFQDIEQRLAKRFCSYILSEIDRAATDESVKKWVKGDEKLVYILNLAEEDVSIDEEDGWQIGKLAFRASKENIISAIQSLTSNLDNGSFFIPSILGKIQFKYSEMTQFKKYFQVYNFETGIDIKEKDKEIEEFHKGSPISVGLLELASKNWDIAVKASCQRCIHSTVISYFENKQQDGADEFWNNQVFRIYHRPSAGGTTFARQILHELKSKFVCIEITNYPWPFTSHEKLYGQLRIIIERCGTFVLILIDLQEARAKGASLKEEDAEEFQEKLRAYSDLVKVLVVERSGDKDLKEPSSFNEKTQTVYISSNLTLSEIQAYQSIFNQYEGAISSNNNTLSKVYLYPIYVFANLANPEKLALTERKIKATMETIIDENELKLLTLVCFLDKYASIRLHLNFVAYILDKNSMEEIETCFGTKSDTSQSDIDEIIILEGNVIKVALSYLNEPIIEALQDKMGCSNFGKMIDTFCRYLIDVVDFNDIDYIENLLFFLLCKKENVEIRTSIKDEDFNKYIAHIMCEHYSLFISEHFAFLGSSNTSNLIKYIADKLESRPGCIHFYALRAKLIFYNEKDQIKGLEEMEKTWKSYPDYTKICSFYCIYGHMIKNHLFSHRSELSKKDYDDFFEKAKYFYVQAQKLPKTDSDNT